MKSLEFIFYEKMKLQNGIKQIIIPMDELAQAFSNCGLQEILTPQQLIAEFHQYIEARGYELNYQEYDMDVEKSIEYHYATEDLKGFRRWMLEEWFWIFHDWISFHYHGTEIDFTKSPAYRNGHFFTEKEYRFFEKSLPSMIHFLWQHEEGRRMYPEEEHSIEVFCDDYLSFWIQN